MRSKLSLLVLAVAFCNFGLLAQERPRAAVKEPVRKEGRVTERSAHPRGEEAKEKAREKAKETEGAIPDDERMRARREELRRKFDGDGDEAGRGKAGGEKAEGEKREPWTHDEHKKRMAERREAMGKAWQRFQQEHPQAAKRILEKADANGDGTVDEAERMNAMQALREKRWIDREARERWHEFERKHPDLCERMKERADRDDDGKVDLRERHEMRERAHDRRDERHDDRQELREDRRERRDDRRDLREDRRDLRQDVREGDRKEVRQGVKELREDHRELRDDRREIRDDHRDLRNDKPAPRQPARR